ncbi:MAG: hypothetical protein D6731_21395 [Planctomycetota bacterium]|nr:MAG: hypothetical protein D6731_21395 [Planctomycetota bacterium]
MSEEAQPATVEDLTISREGDDRMAPRRELRKKVVTSGSWATVLYEYDELKRSKKGEEWVRKYSLVRYRKLKGSYRFQKEFALSSRDHVAIVRDTFAEWLAADGEDAGGEG